MSNILEKKSIEWFNYENKIERLNKVTRDLDGSVDAVEIKSALTEMDFNIIDVSNVPIKKDNSCNVGEKIKIKASLHMLTCDRNEDLKKMFDIVYVRYSIY